MWLLIGFRWNFGDSCYHNSGAEMNWSLFNTFTFHLHNSTVCSGIIWIYVNVILWKPPLCKDTAALMKIRFDAHDYCLDIGGYLVEIDTKEEEDWLLGAFAVYDQVGFYTKLSFFRCNSISSTVSPSVHRSVIHKYLQIFTVLVFQDPHVYCVPRL